jgi:hypothetical protein
MARNRARLTGGLLAAAVALGVAGCGGAVDGLGPGGPLPAGVMSAAQACARVVQKSPVREYLHRIRQVDVVLTTYAKGEPVESGGDISTGMPPGTLVWVVAVHAKTVDPLFSGPPGARVPEGNSYSVVMNARTGLVTDSGLSAKWPLPLWKAGTVVSLSPDC